MIESISAIDKSVFLFLNDLHALWLDPIMFWISGKKTWFPLYALLLFFIVKHFKWQSIPILIGLIITIVLADQVTSGFMKPFFERLRPSHEPSLAGLVHHVNQYKGGRYGFASSHAANTFGVAVFLWLNLRSHYKWGAFLFVWAGVVSYSRIYLGVHYPGDILVGAGIGALAGYLVTKKVLPLLNKIFEKHFQKNHT